jgi:hypothetical protein
MENKTIIHGYIPEVFRQYWNGNKAFPTVIPMTEWDEQQDRINKKKRKQMLLTARRKFIHKSRGGFSAELYQKILDVINESYNDDWYYDGQDEYQERTFQPEVAANRLTKLYAKWKSKI